MQKQSLPYEVISQIGFKLAGTTTFRTLLKEKQ